MIYTTSQMSLKALREEEAKDPSRQAHDAAFAEMMGAFHEELMTVTEMVTELTGVIEALQGGQ